MIPCAMRTDVLEPRRSKAPIEGAGAPQIPRPREFDFDSGTSWASLAGGWALFLRLDLATLATHWESVREMPAHTEKPVVDTVAVLNLRLLVGILGEKTRFGWWQTGFFDPTSQAFLAPVFVKTALLSCYHGVVEAARRVHDEGLSVGSYHLFRLPEEMEQDLHAEMCAGVPETFLKAATGDRDPGLALLRELGGSPQKATSASGPILLGSMLEFSDKEMLQRIARVYLDGFSGGAKPIPYLSGSA